MSSVFFKFILSYQVVLPSRFNDISYVRINAVTLISIIAVTFSSCFTMNWRRQTLKIANEKSSLNNYKNKKKTGWWVEHDSTHVTVLKYKSGKRNGKALDFIIGEQHYLTMKYRNDKLVGNMIWYIKPGSPVYFYKCRRGDCRLKRSYVPRW